MILGVAPGFSDCRAFGASAYMRKCSDEIAALR